MIQHYSSTKQKILVKVGQKIVGRIQENRFVKHVSGSKHKLRYPPAWAIDAEVFDTEVRANAAEIVVVDRETETEYRCPVQVFDRLKGELDRGFGRQYFLPMNYWQTESNGAKQLSLWGGDSIA